MFKSQEIMFLSNVSDSVETDIAPGKGKLPISTMGDDFCQELPFPYLFSERKFVHKKDRQASFSPVNYSNGFLITLNCLHPTLIILLCITTNTKIKATKSNKFCHEQSL